jgi:predicted small lipoprotein YifL
MPNRLTALLLAIAFATLVGCGQTGPLYMPGQEPPKHKQSGTISGAKQPPAAPSGSGGAVAQPQVATPPQPEPTDGIDDAVAQPKIIE